MDRCPDFRFQGIGPRGFLVARSNPVFVRLDLGSVACGSNRGASLLDDLFEKVGQTDSDLARFCT